MNQRIYVNSWLQSQEGDDTSFVVRFDQTFTAKQLILNTFICDNLFTPWYRSKNKDFRKLGLIVGGVTYQATIDQNIESFAQMIEFFNSQGFPIKMVQIATTKTYLNTVSFKVQNLTNIDQQSILIGDAWEKLGFVIDGVQSIQKDSVRSFDFSQPPAIAVLIQNLPRPFDSFSFLIPNNSSYGSKLFYTANQTDNLQKIIFNSPQSFNYMKIQLLNCDLMPLETPRQNNNKTNDNEMECLIVFDII